MHRCRCPLPRHTLHHHPTTQLPHRRCSTARRCQRLPRHSAHQASTPHAMVRERRVGPACFASRLARPCLCLQISRDIRLLSISSPPTGVAQASRPASSRRARRIRVATSEATGPSHENTLFSLPASDSKPQRAFPSAAGCMAGLQRGHLTPSSALLDASASTRHISLETAPIRVERPTPKLHPVSRHTSTVPTLIELTRSAV